MGYTLINTNEKSHPASVMDTTYNYKHLINYLLYTNFVDLPAVIFTQISL